MTSTGSYEDLFRKEISKYDLISEDIGHNIEAQEQLLLQIQVQFFLQSIFPTSVFPVLQQVMFYSLYAYCITL